jgi:hypothetical protein
MTMNDDLHMPNPLGPDAQAILEAARDADNPRESDRTRVGRVLLNRVAAAGAVGAGTSLFASSAAAASLAKSILLPALLVVAGGVLGGAVVWSTRPVALPPATPSTPVVVTPPGATSPAPVIAAPGGQAASLESPSLESPSSRPVAPTVPKHLAGETALLAEVTVALRNGDARQGLRLLDAYQRRYPAGILREEMRGARIIARCQLADQGGADAALASAREVARDFLRRYPASPLAPRIRKACDSPVR